ncbi:MAG: ribosome maturation factor RimP, partial [Streptococcaceae bacterium]|nr:ribosome maturation factor RimP [Streptococcaceae bacterium]
GAERPLKKEADYENAMNQYIMVKLYQKIEGVKEFVGDLVALDKENQVITLEIRDKTRTKKMDIPLDKISKANTLVKL